MSLGKFLRFFLLWSSPINKREKMGGGENGKKQRK